MRLSESNLKYCVNAGYLVGGSYWIPDALFDHQGNEWATVGCNQIFCSECKEFVRHRSDYDMGSYSARDERTRAPILFATENWDTIEFLKPTNSRITRIYYCACFCCTQSNSMPMDGSGDHLIYGASYSTNWRCKGHPPFKFPTEVYGIRLKTTKDLSIAVNAVMEHRELISDPIPYDETDPEAFLISRLYARLNSIKAKKSIDTLIASFLIHPNSLYRFVACKHIERFPASFAASELLNVYRRQPELFDGVLHPHHERGTYPYMRLKLISLEQQFKNALLAYLKFSNSTSSAR